MTVQGGQGAREEKDKTGNESHLPIAADYLDDNFQQSQEVAASAFSELGLLLYKRTKSWGHGRLAGPVSKAIYSFPTTG